MVLLGASDRTSPPIHVQQLWGVPEDTRFALSPKHRVTLRRVQGWGPSHGAPIAPGQSGAPKRIWEHNRPFGKFDINDLETIFGLFRGGSLNLHLKTPEELVVLAGGRERWPGALNGKLFCLMLPGPKKCELCRFLAPFMVRIAGSVVGAWLLCSQLLTALLKAGFPSLPKQSGVL